MKLCRFELSSAPGFPRSGFVFQGKLYETDGQNPVGIYDPSETRLLMPLPMPTSIRLFDLEKGEPSFRYLNPASAFGPADPFRPPTFATPVRYEPCVGVVSTSEGRDISVEDADGVVLGLVLLNSFFSGDGISARSRDVGLALGPAITTPDELEDVVSESSQGRRYDLSIAASAKQEDERTVNLSDMPYTFAELISIASESAPIRPGDVVAVPLFLGLQTLESGDQVKVFSEKLGALTTLIV